MKRLMVAALVLVFVGVTTAQAAENPTGTWKWERKAGKDGKSRETTLKLKLEGDKLTGTITGRGGKEIEIEEGKFANDEVSFKMTREFKGNKLTIKYSGKVSGDTIKGKIDTDFDGKSRSSDWEAKRVKE